jgi:hypothetical protein
MRALLLNLIVIALSTAQAIVGHVWVRLVRIDAAGGAGLVH